MAAGGCNPPMGRSKSRKKKWASEDRGANTGEKQREFPGMVKGSCRWQLWKRPTDQQVQIRRERQRAPRRDIPERKVEMTDYLTCLTIWSDL